MDKKALLLISLISIFGVLSVLSVIRTPSNEGSILNPGNNNANINTTKNTQETSANKPLNENETENPGSEIAETEQAEKRNLLELEKSITDIFETSEQLICTGNIEESGSIIDSELYISGDEIRGKFNITSDQGTYTSNILKDENNKMYIWTDIQEQGYLVTLDEDSETESMQYIKSYISNESDLKCENTSLDPNLFNLPNNIEFIDIGENLQGLIGQ